MILLGGIGAVIAGGFSYDGSYLQATLLQFGSTGLLLVPLLLIERSITLRWEARLDDEAAIQRTEQYFQLDEMWRDFGQKMKQPQRATVSAAQLGQMLTTDGWRYVKTARAYDLWRSGTDLLAMPKAADPLPQPVVRGVLRRAGWSDERFEQLLSMTTGDRG